MRLRSAVPAVVAVGALALCGCTADRSSSAPTGPVPSASEVQSLLGASASKVDDIAGDRADVMIDVTPLVIDAATTPRAASIGSLTIVAACVLSKSSGGPRGFATGVMPTDEVTSEIRAKAVAGAYRALLGRNCRTGG